MNVSIRPSTLEDVDHYMRIAPLVKSKFNLVFNKKVHAKFFFERDLVRMILLGELVVGYISVETWTPRTTYLPKRIALISHFAVEPARQQQGIGSTALDMFLFELVVGCDIRTFEAYVHPEHPALKMFLIRGFRQRELVKNYQQSRTPRLFLRRRV